MGVKKKRNEINNLAAKLYKGIWEKVLFLCYVTP